MQTTSHLLMIRPVHFGYNAQTAVNNTFQTREKQGGVQERALREFDTLVVQLRTRGIDVTVIEDSPLPHTPDAIFPNNWISFHDQQTLCLYPMFAPNRRQERKSSVLEILSQKFSFKHCIDLTHYETSGQFLEGTGSMVLDRDFGIAYAGISPRTDPQVLADFCRQTGYRSSVFHAADKQARLIYHTNVMMCVADRFVVICLESIRDPEEKKSVKETIGSTAKEIIPISLDQMNHFAGNMLQVENAAHEKFLVMSTAAYQSLSREQLDKLSSFNQFLHSPLNSIETNGGGSARCMIAEIHGIDG
ncbi:MAG: citrulline utilization hydrolase CtlX [Chitinophagales bacterium]